MKVICKNCNKKFKPDKRTKEKYKEDGLCGYCRSRAKFLENPNKYKKTKHCPECGKTILQESKRCGHCAQLGKNNHQYKHGKKRTFGRFCDCGNEISTGSFGKCRDCYSKTLSGNKNPNYRFGHYMRGFYSTAKYKFWRTSVYKKDNYTCQKCGSSKSGTLEAHHIFSKRDYPNLVYELENGITLCQKCHSTTFTIEDQFITSFLDDETITKLLNINNGED